MMSHKTRVHHYTECGLDYVYLLNGFDSHETAYGVAISVRHAADLDRQIAMAIVNDQGPLTGQEVRFLRGLLDLTQQELGVLLGKDAQSVARWENSKTAIPRTEDFVLRQIYSEETGKSARFIDTSRRVAKLKSRLGNVGFQHKPKGAWEKHGVDLTHAELV